MASIAALKGKIKTLRDFIKVVNIQKIVVMKEISQWQKIIDKATAMRQIFVEMVIDLNNKYRALPKEVVASQAEKKKTRKIPVQRDLHFIFEGSVADNIADYELEVIKEFCKKNNNPSDIYVIVGKKLALYMKKHGFYVMNEMEAADLADSTVYRRIGHQIIAAFDDLIFNKASFGFLDTSTRQFNQEYIFPLETSDKDPKEMNLEELESVAAMKINKVNFIKDYDEVAQSLVRLAIESVSYQKIVEYSLVMKRRELQSLDDKEKNIEEEIELVNLKMQRARKDAVTNELLTNATAFAALSEEEEYYPRKKKKEGE